MKHRELNSYADAGSDPALNSRCAECGSGDGGDGCDCETRCRECLGYGWIDDETPCGICGGSGQRVTK